MDSAWHVTFNYDSDGKLLNIEDSNSQTHLGRTFLHYNSQNKLVKATMMRYYGSLNNLLSQYTDSFVYDNSNRIIRRLSLSTQNPSYRTYNIYSYDAQNRLLVDSIHSPLSNRVEGFQEFTYDGNDNIVQMESFRSNSGTFSTERVTKSHYTSQKNPFYNLGVTAYFIIRDEDLTMLSKNTPKQVIYRLDYTTDYGYEYYQNGQPKKLTETHKQPNYSSLSTTEFFYE
jgi:hypothetical protein